MQIFIPGGIPVLFVIMMILGRVAVSCMIAWMRQLYLPRLALKKV